MDGMKSACCLFDNEKKKIILYYVGDLSQAQVASFLKEKLSRYMIPNVIEALEQMPLTSNGKINRVLMKERYYDSKRV
jgi:acyl-CoA synthetase (AMP-forming)/AMP-acid ligase II